MLLLQMLHSTKPGSVLLPRVCLSVTLRPSLPSSGIPAASCLNLSLVSQSWSRSTGLSGSLSFSNPPGPSLDFGFSVQTWPPPPPKSRSSPRPAGRPGSVRSGGRPPGLSAPAPPTPSAPPPRSSRPDPSGEQGAAGRELGFGARFGGELTSKRAAGAGKAGRASLGGSYLRAEQSWGRASCRRRCRLHTDCVGEWERGPNPSPRKCARGPPRPDPAPGRPCPRGADPALAPHLRGRGPDPAHPSSLGWSPLQAPSAGSV